MRQKVDKADVETTLWKTRAEQARNTAQQFKRQLENSKKTAEEEVTLWKTRAEQVGNAAQQFKRQVEDAENRLLDMAKERDAAQLKATNDVATAQNDLATSQQQVGQLQNDVATLQNDLATSQQQVGQLQNDLAAAAAAAAAPPPPAAAPPPPDPAGADPVAAVTALALAELGKAHTSSAALRAIGVGAPAPAGSVMEIVMDGEKLLDKSDITVPLPRLVRVEVAQVQGSERVLRVSEVWPRNKRIGLAGERGAGGAALGVKVHPSGALFRCFEELRAMGTVYIEGAHGRNVEWTEPSEGRGKSRSLWVQ